MAKPKTYNADPTAESESDEQRSLSTDILKPIAFPILSNMTLSTEEDDLREQDMSIVSSQIEMIQNAAELVSAKNIDIEVKCKVALTMISLLKARRQIYGNKYKGSDGGGGNGSGGGFGFGSGF